jgi:tRNA dimethylallyltransferase
MVTSPRPPLVVITGPTGVGKTEVAVRLARLLPIEVVSADSRQVYRRMDIGTGKPTPAQLRTVPHHLIDVVDPDERYHAARFRAEAGAAIRQIRERGRLPVVVGGTGLYIRALVRGLLPAPPADLTFRARLADWANREGTGALHGVLRECAPEAARRIHPRDRIRLIRALEIHRLTGKPLEPEAHWRERPPEFRLLMVGLTVARDALYRALEARVDRMVQLGLIPEVERLLDAGYGAELSSMHGLGYRHFAGVIRGRWSYAHAVSAMKRDTKRYAKRQWTWFAREPEIQWMNVEAAGGIEGTAEIVGKLVEQGGFLP